MAAPKLRFKEFDGDWGKITIGDQSETVTSGSRDWAQYYSESGDKFIRMTNLVRDGINLDLSDLKFVQLPDDSNEGKRTSLRAGDILISITAELGKLGWIPEGLGTAYINQHTALVRLKNKMDSKFIAYGLSTEKYNNKLNSLNDSGAKAGLNLGTIRGFELTVPQKSEQTKIAAFLSAVDDKISQLTQKHQLLSQYKQGMMQKLFSQQIRFKADDGSEFGEWVVKPLHNFIVNHIGGAALTPSDFVEKSNYEVIPKKAIMPNGRLILNINQPTYCSENFFNANLKNTVDQNYLITVLRDLVPSGPSIGYIVQFQSSKKYILAQGVYGFKITPNLNKEYLIHFSNTKRYRLIMKSIMVGSTQVHIRNQDFFSIEIPFPCLEEQTKIANFLSAIDQKIEVVAQQIEQAKQWKKGLLQQMFV